MPNTRTSPRLHYFAEVDVIRPGHAKAFTFWGENLSESGIFLQTNQPWVVGERVALRLPVENDRVLIRDAEVTWVRRFEPISVDGSMAGMGLRFLSVDPPSRAAIRRIVERGASTPEALAAQNAMPSPTTEVLTMLSLPPTDSNEFTLKGWALRKAPRSTNPPRATDASNDDHDARNLEESAPWSIGPVDAARMNASIQRSARHEASRAPVPALTRPPTKAMDELDDTLPPSLAALLGDDDIEDLAAHASCDDDDDDDDVARDIVSFRRVDDDGAHPDSMNTDADDTARIRRGKNPAPAETTATDAVSFRMVVDEERARARLSQAPAVKDDGAQNEPMDSFIPTLRPAKEGRAFLGATLIAVGAIGGIFVGLDGAPEKATVAPAITETATAAPRSVDDAERALQALLLDDGEAAAAPSSSSVPADAVAAPVTTPPGAHVAVLPTTSPATTASEVPVSDKLPRRGEVMAATEMTATAAAPLAPSDAESSTLVVEHGRVSVPLTGGRVLKSFGLENPSRVVVDLDGANIAAFKEILIGEKGVEKIRFGRPTTETTRVVVELQTTHAPVGISTLKKDGSLAIAWR